MRRPVLLLALTTGLLAVGTTAPVWAAPPEREAWYSALSVGPIVLPAPTVPEGDLQVGGTGAQPTAYATLALTGADGGELVLAIRPNGAGTPALAACPTATPTWEAGGNQAFDAGPEYDCATGLVLGVLALDGSSVSFPLDSSVPAASIALVPLPEVVEPFTVVLGDAEYTPGEPLAEAAPEPVVEEPAAAPAPAPDTSAPAPVADPGPAFDSGTSAESTPLELPAEPLPEQAPEALPVTPEAPLEAPVATGEQVLPTARVATTSADDRQGARLLALLALAGVSAAAGYAAGQQRPAPRLLGGRARALPAGAAAAANLPAVIAPAATELPRGIGRFARVRDAAPRRLR